MGAPGSGIASMKQTKAHTIRGWGRWWKTQEDLDAYAEMQKLQRRARDAGYGLHQIDEFRELENRTRRGLDSLRNREKWVKAEMARLKKKHGLPSHANRAHLKAVAERTGDPELFSFLSIMSTATLNDTERIAQIRQLFLEGRTYAEIIYETAHIVGIKLKEKK
jgi:hypothetical protein